MPLGSDFAPQDFFNPDFNPADFSPADFVSRSFSTRLDSGPPYPPSPSLLQRQHQVQLATGEFDFSAAQIAQIGVSQIGDVIPFSYWDTIISQYANSSIITSLIGSFQQWIDQTANMQALYEDIWDVLTARDYGLDVWGRIVGVQRVVQIQTSKFFGFEEQTPATVEDFGPGGVGPFYRGVPATSSFALADQSFRTLILAKAMANISSGSVPSINAILRSLFPNRGNCFVTDGGNMTMTFTFQFPITKAEFAVVSTSGVLPKPSGVSATIIFPGFI